MTNKHVYLSAFLQILNCIGNMLIFNMNMRKIKRIGMVAFKALLFKKKQKIKHGSERNEGKGIIDTFTYLKTYLLISG